jgi:hypothetical protein
METIVQPVDIPPAQEAQPGAVVRRLFCFPVLLGALLVAGGLVVARFNLADPDMWSHAATGREILATRTFPTADAYSFTASGNASMAFEWLGDVMLAEAADRGGFKALLVLLYVLAASLTVLLYYYACQRCGNSKAAFVACAAVLPLASAFFTPRPQLLGYVFLLITLICLERFRQGRTKALWILPAVFVLWVNTHGSFVLGLIAFGVYWASGLAGFEAGGLKAERWTPGQRQQLALAFLLSLVALAVTPYGTQVAGFTLHVIFNAPIGMSHITEYQPLGASGELLKFFLAMLLPFLLAQVALWPGYRLEEVVLLVGGIYGACTHSRLLFFFAVVFAPLLASLLSRWVPGYEPAKDHHGANAVLLVLLTLALTRFLPSPQAWEQEVARKYPVRAVDYLQQHPVPGPMFNPYAWGGYLMWRWGPQHRLFIDGRSQLYEDAGVFGDYLRMTALDRGTLLLMRKYGLKACLVERQSPLATLLSTLPDWERIYQDDLSTIYVCKRASGVS